MNKEPNQKKTTRLLWLAIIVLTVGGLTQAFWIVQLSRSVESLQLFKNQHELKAPQVKDEAKAVPIRIATPEDLERIQALMDEGKYEEALEEHIWYHEASRYSPSLAGVRASFALGYWVDLGKRYPPAHEALIELRDQYRDTAITGTGGFNEVMDLFAIHRALEDNEAAIKDFRLLVEKSPEVAPMAYLFVEDLLIEKRAYDLVRQFMTDPILKFEELRMRRESELSYATTAEDIEKTFFLKNADKGFVTGVTTLVKTLVAIDRPEEARTVQKRALEYYPNEEISAALE